MSTSDDPIITYQIQYLDEFNLWEDVPHKTIYDIGTLKDVLLRTRNKFPSTDIRVLKVTKEVFELEDKLVIDTKQVYDD